MAHFPVSRVLVLLHEDSWELDASGQLTVEKSRAGQPLELPFEVAHQADAVVIDAALVVAMAGPEALRRFFDQTAKPIYLLYRDATAVASFLREWAGEALVGVAPMHPSLVARALAKAGLGCGGRLGGGPAAEAGRGLSGELEMFLAQVRPQVMDEFVLVRLVAAPVTKTVPQAEGVSVLIWAKTPVAEELDQAIFSALHQEVPPLEIVLCLGRGKAPLPEAEWGEEAAAAGIRFLCEEAPESSGEAALLNRGLERVRGRYVAFVASNAIVFPTHFARLRAALVAGGQACALAKAQQALVTQSAVGYVQAKIPHHGWSAVGWPRFDAALPSRLMVDLSRVAPFHFRFREDGDAWRDSLFPALFGACEPVEIDDAPSVELRVAEVESESVVNELAKSPVRVLRTVSREQVWRPSVLLRHRAADAVNTALKTMLPGVHRRLRKFFARRLEEP
ncbi:MAG: glycosyltransferase family A protein [Myxococcaceae bacterium]